MARYPDRFRRLSRRVPARCVHHGRRMFVEGAWEIWEYDSPDLVYFCVTHRYAGSRLVWRACERGFWEDLPVADRIKEARKMVDAIRARRPGGGHPGLASDGALESLHPSVYAFLVLAEPPSGGMGAPASITLFCEEGVFKCVLNDKGTGCSLWASGATFALALENLEMRLSADVVDWRAPRAVPSAGKGTRRKG